MAHVVIIGAGLAGSLLAIYLARRGFRVDVFEARSDMRSTTVAAGRSINLALSDRGIAALREVGMDQYMLAEAMPMFGRMIHSTTGSTKLLPYSGRKGEYINSVSRAGLNIALMNEAEKFTNVQFVFGRRCVGFNPGIGEVMFENGRTIRGDTVIATDGAGSAIRDLMSRAITDFQLSEVLLEHGYKELHIPPGHDGGFQLDKNALHIWPRHKFMMIALPNYDGSFTCTLFLAHTGGNPSTGVPAAASASGVRARSEGVANETDRLPTGRVSAFDSLTTPDSLIEFFSREFPDAVPLMPARAEDFFHNPTGHLGTIKCWPWNLEGKVLLLGDSAHAMVPFYGQGMNCAFEDVRMLDGLIEKHGSDWATIYEEYGLQRKPNADAIQDMAEENFYEMRDATADPVFQRKRELETKLEQTYTDYFSKYSMVTFREDLPYSIAKARGNAQDKLLMQICAGVSSVDEIDTDAVVRRVRELEA